MVIDHVLHDVGEGYSEDGDVSYAETIHAEVLHKRKLMRGEEREEDSFFAGKVGKFSGDILWHLSLGPEAREVVEMKSGHMEEVKEDQDLAKASSLITEAIQEHVILPIHQGLQQNIILNLFLPPCFEIMS